jgi:hypothetical protein
MLFVQAVDDQFYINPQVNGANWFLQCDDDGCEVHVKVYPKTNRESARKRALKVLREKDVSVKILDWIGEDTTLFPNSTTLDLEAGFTVQLRKPIPIPDKYDEVVSAPPLEHPFIAWKMEFERDAILSIFDDSKRMNQLLVKFLTGKVLVKDEDRKPIKRILRRLVSVDDLPERVTLEI